ncbi:MAG: SDR family NAD(P)-dependent oxidoreductase [Flavobacteriaceae bacterium]
MNAKDLLNLEGKVILVSGGAGSYGKSIVEGLAEAGGTAIIASRNLKNGQVVAEAFRGEGLDVHAMQVGQGIHESVLSLKKEILKLFGKLHVFVNNAVARPMKGYDDSIENFAESM